MLIRKLDYQILDDIYTENLQSQQKRRNIVRWMD